MGGRREIGPEHKRGRPVKEQGTLTRLIPWFDGAILFHEWKGTLHDKGIAARSCKHRETPVRYHMRHCKRRNRIFFEPTLGALRDLRRVSRGQVRCRRVYSAAIAPAAPVTFWL